MNERSLPNEAAAVVEQWLGTGCIIEPLAGDASVRAYYRVRTPEGEPVMLAYYPEEVRPQLARFVSAYRALAPHARVPEVLRSSESLILQNDVGDQTIFDLLHRDRVAGIDAYRSAVELIVAFQRAGDPGLNAAFTADFFVAELEMALEFYAAKLMGADAETCAQLRPALISLANGVSRHPYLLCHRDYHGQNIHLHNGTLFVIDYQDLRMGPDTYDLASLLRDRGVARLLGEEAEMELVEAYASLIGSADFGPRGNDAGRAEARSPRTVRHRYFETLLQRSVKILGTFAKQPIVRGRMHYLDFIPATLESVARCVRELPQYADVTRLLPMEFSLDAARARAARLHDETAASGGTR